jgi:plasmid stabilization system protein ParE
MAQIRWSLHAIEQLEAQCEYIAKDSVFYANLFAKKINNP